MTGRRRPDWRGAAIIAGVVVVVLAIGCVGRPRFMLGTQRPFSGSSPRDRPPVAQSAARERDAAASLAGDDQLAVQVQASLAAILGFVLTGGAAPILATMVGFFDEDRLIGARPPPRPATVRQPRLEPAQPAGCGAFLCGPIPRAR
jgi:hypothetical protein